MKRTDVKQTEFIAQLKKYKKLMDADIDQYCQQLLSETHESFGQYPAEAVKAYCAILNRGGKRIRGALTMTSYKMLGGKNEEVALQAARAIEMLHAYILMVDDIQDRSNTRRGGPTGHVMLADYHRSEHLKNNSEHFGISITLNAFLIGAHSAMNVLADLDVPEQFRLNAIKNVNTYFISTAHGQTMDVFNEVVETVDEEDVNKVLLWKTAFYTFMNPLQLGAILAGASEEDLSRLESYSLAAGRVFQITDDIIGTFSEEKETGKSPLDDIREGKRTLLTVKAIEQAPKADSYFLEQMLGNNELTQAEFLRCKKIIEDSGALEYARMQAKHSAVDALASLDDVRQAWSGEQVAFLEQLVLYLTERKS